jgi:MFS family permease
MLIAPKLLAFFISLSGVGWNRFSVFLLMKNGLSASQIGTLKTFGFILKIFAQPVWGLVADTTSLKTALILSLCLCSLTLEAVRLALAYHMPFFLFLITRSLRASVNGISPVCDAILVKSAKKQNEGYGKQKLFSSLGWGVGAFVYGLIVDSFGLNSIFYSTYFFCILSVFLVSSMNYLDDEADGSGNDSENAIQETSNNANGGGGNDNTSSRKTSNSSTSNENSVKQSKKTSNATNTQVIYNGAKTKKNTQRPLLVLQNTYTLLKQPGILFFASQFFLFGFVMVLADGILYMQLEQEFHSSRKFNGLTTLISTLSALPTYWFAEKILNRRGALFMLHAAQGIAAFRFFLTGFINESNIIFILPLQLLHGITFAMNWSAGVEILQSASPPSITASVQVIATTLYFTLGQGAGYIILTRIYEIFGGSKTFFFGASLLAINLSISKYLQPKLSNRNVSRLYGKKNNRIEEKTVEEIV